jgi:hypothetical protein
LLSNLDKQTPMLETDIYERRLVVCDGSICLMPHLGLFLKEEVAEMMSIWIPESILKIGSKLFDGLHCFHSISFDSPSRLTRIEPNAFLFSSLQSIVIPSSVEILCSECFSYWKSLSSISFESNSGLARIKSYIFSNSSLQSIEIPSSVEILCPIVFRSVCHFHQFQLNQSHD